jgi:DNA invertase Pin-like site-specific DNA recombinase
MQLGKVRVAQQLVKARGTVEHVETASDNQRRELEAVAERSGWKVVQVYQDAGFSGAKGRDQRPGLDAMMKAVNAREFDMVASWSVDLLYPDERISSD